MARAKSHFTPGYIWHIAHRCNKRKFLPRQIWLLYLVGVESKCFVEKLKSVLIDSVSGRKVKKSEGGYQLGEPSAPYKVNFDVENDDIGPENRHFGDINVD